MNLKGILILSIFALLLVVASSVTAADIDNTTADNNDLSATTHENQQLNTTSKQITTTHTNTSSDTNTNQNNYNTENNNKNSLKTSNENSGNATIEKTSTENINTTTTTKSIDNSNNNNTKVQDNSNTSNTKAQVNSNTTNTTQDNSNKVNSTTHISNQKEESNTIQSINENNKETVDLKTDLKQATTNTIIVNNESQLPSRLANNTIYIIDGLTISNQQLLINGENITLTGINNATFIDTYVYVGVSYRNITISNLTFEYTSNYTKEEGICIQDGARGEYTDPSVYAILENCNMTIEARTLSESESWFPIYTTTFAVIIRNNNFIGDFYCYSIDYNSHGNYMDIPQTGLIRAETSGSSTIPTIITGNNITINATLYEDTNPNATKPTFYAITVDNSYVNITDNNINLTGTQWMYAIRTYSSNSNITNNNVTVTSDRYASGIYLSGYSIHNNTVSNNIVDLKVGDKPNTGYPEDVAYCIIIENYGYQGGQITSRTSTLGYCSNNTLINNTLTASGNNVYGIELFGANDTQIIENNITLNGSTPMGIGMVAGFTNITNNNITVTGNTSQSGQTVDYISARTAGVCTTRGISNNITENNITSNNNSAIFIRNDDSDYVSDNKLTVNDYDYGIDLSANNTEIIDNQIRIDGTIDNLAIEENGVNNTIETTELSTLILIDSLNSTQIYLDTIEINAILLDSKNNIITGETITLIVNNQTIGTNKTDNTGRFRYNYTITNEGINTIVLEYNGSTGAYKSCTAEAEFNAKIITSIVLTSESSLVYDNSTVNLTGTLKTNSGQAISNADIKLSINGTTTTISTDNNGNYNYTYKTVENIRNTTEITITATYDGDSLYIATDTFTTLTIIPKATSITVDQVESKNGYTILLKATITDQNGNPVNYGQATFKLNGVTIKVNGTQLKTDVVNGVAQVNYTIPNYSAKDYNLTAVYGYLDNRLEVSSVLTIFKSDPELILDNITSNGTTGHITGIFLDEHGLGVDRDTKVAVKINGKTVLNTVIYDGIIDLEFDTSAYKDGIHNLTVIFGENGCYSTVTYNGKIAQNIADCVIIDQVSGKNYDNVSLNAYFIDEYGNSATSGSATFKLNSVTIKENGTQIKVNIVNGVATYNYTIPDYSAKDYNLTAVGSISSNRYENTTVLTILKTDTYIDLSSMSISQGSDAQLVGTIFDKEDNPVNLDTKIAVKINGKTVLNTKVENGSINLTLDTSSYSEGSYNVTVVAGEDGRFATSTADTILTIKS